MPKANLETFEIWLMIAKSDLKAAVILYNNKQYRTSYFLFQQAVEKANKGYALKHKMATEDALFDARHDLLKMFRRILINKVSTLDSSLGEIQSDLIANTKEYLKIKKKQKSFSEFIKGIDQLRNIDLVNISTSDLNLLLNEFENSIFLNLSLPESFNRKAKAMVLTLLNRLDLSSTKKSLAAKKSIEKLMENKDQFRLIYEFVSKALNTLNNTLFIPLILYACAIITNQHSTLTRYPHKGRNPLNIYTLRFPVIKAQPRFMALLEKAIDNVFVTEDD